MVHPLSRILLLMSLFSFVFSTKNIVSIANSYNLTINSSISVGEQTIKLDDYVDSDGLRNLLQNLEQEYSQIVTSIVIGNTGLRKPIYAVRISRNVQEKRKLLVPMFKYVANINGDETVGYALMVSLIQYLVYSDGVDEDVTRLLNTTDIWIVPSMNPDRLYSLENKNNQTLNPPKYPFNGRGVELDHDFPNSYLNLDYTWTLQEETQSMLDFIKKNPFVLSGNLKGGAIAARYPFDRDVYPPMFLVTDEEVFVKLSRDYTGHNPMMTYGNPCLKFFSDKRLRISDSPDNNWTVDTLDNILKKNHFCFVCYLVNMGEANFLSSNCFEITFHVSCCKWAPPSDLPSYWALNLPSMLNYIDSIHQGIYGLVRDKKGNPVKGAIVQVKGKVHWVKTTEDGEYWRLLVPGLYNVTVHPSASFIMETKLVNLTEDNRYVQLDFLLERPSFYGYVVTTDNGKPIKEGTIMYKKIEENRRNRRRRVEDPRTFKRPCYIHINEGEFGDTLAPGTYNITVIVLGYKKENTIVTINEKEPVELNFSLNRRGVFGTVTNENNMPLKEAVIKVLSKDGTIHKTDNRNVLSSVPAVSSNFRKLETKTDENGEYWLFLESGNYRISVTAPGYKHQNLTLMIQDSECQHFRLQQQDYFQGVEGFIFKAKSRTPLRGTIRISNTKESIVLKSDVNRMFRRYLDIGFYEIEASAHGYETQIKDISIKKKSLNSVEFYLLPPIKKGKVS